MIIDFHTHTFPDAIADKTIAYLENKAHSPAFRKGTVTSLIELMKESRVDYSVVLPVATTARQIPTINKVSYELNGKDHLIYFGGIHPDCENVEEVLDDIKAHNLAGIKLHPDYQGVFFNDKRYLHILSEAAKRDLLIVTHAGFDPGFPEETHCTPDHILDVWKQIGDQLAGKLILAHLGASESPEEVLEKLAGLDLYLDTAYVLDRYPAKAKEIICAHGANRILFASDSPWADQKKFVTVLHSLELSPEEEAMILGQNAARLLASQIPNTQ